MMSNDLRDACRQQLEAAGQTYSYYSLAELAKTYPSVARLPYSMKVLLENLLRNQDGSSVTAEDIEAVATWSGKNDSPREIASPDLADCADKAVISPMRIMPSCLVQPVRPARMLPVMPVRMARREERIAMVHFRPTVMAMGYHQNKTIQYKNR